MGNAEDLKFFEGRFGRFIQGQEMRRFYSVLPIELADEKFGWQTLIFLTPGFWAFFNRIKARYSAHDGCPRYYIALDIASRVNQDRSTGLARIRHVAVKAHTPASRSRVIATSEELCNCSGV
jgi:hypothetical protein